MKNKLSRVLVLLLAIAMMIPGFAMAEEATPVTEGKLEITSTEKEIKDTFLSGEEGSAISTEKNKIKFAYAVPTNAADTPTLNWTSSNPYVAIVAPTTVAKGDSKTDQTVTVTKKGVGTAKITGQLSYDGKVQKTAEFTVTLEAVDVESIAFVEGITTKYMVSSEAVPFANLVKVTAKEGGSTYTAADLAWKIVSNGDLAEVNNSGKVLFEKAGEVTLRAYIPGSEKKAEVMLTVLEKDPGTSIEQVKNGYTFLDFNTPDEDGLVFHAIESKDGKSASINLSNYLTKRSVGADTTDTLDWTVDDESIAQVTAGNVTINKAGQGKKVKVTVTSHTTGESDWCYVIWEEKDTSKPYTKLAFNPTEKTFRVEKKADWQWYEHVPNYERNDNHIGDGTYGEYTGYKRVKISDLLSVKEPTDAKDTLVWGSNDYSVATFEYDGDDVYLKPLKLDTEVTITAQSKLDKTVITNPGLKVKFVEEATEIPYTKIEFDGEKKLPVKKGVNQTVKFDLKKYLTLEPSKANETLTFTSSDDYIATVDKVTGKLTVVAKKSGTAKITVENKKGTLSDVLTVDVTVVTDPYTTLEFKKSLDHKKTLKMTKGMTQVDLSVDLNTEGGSDDEQRWTSNDETVAKVTNRGLVTLVGEGTTKITVRNYDGTKTDYIDLTVEEVKKPYTKFVFKDADKDITTLTKKLSEKSVDLLGKYLYAEPKVVDSDDELNWISLNLDVATVNKKNGVVTFLAAGTAKIKVFNADQSASAEITITIVDDKDIIKTITPVAESVTIKIGDKIDLDDYVTTDPATSDVDELVWTCKGNDQQVVQFSADGETNAIAKGEVTVTVYSRLNPENKKSFKLVVSEKEGKVETLKILEGNDQFTLKTGEGDIYLSRYVLVTPADALDTTVYGDTGVDALIYTSDDTDILTVERDTGLVHLNGKPGTAKITVRSKKNPEAKAQFTITHAKGDLKSIKFVDAPKTLSRSKGRLDLSAYVVTDPWYYATKYSEDLFWDSSDPQIAAVTNKNGDEVEGGYVYWQKLGKVTITVRDKAGKVTPASVELEMIDPEAVTKIALKDITLEPGEWADINNFLTYEPLDADLDNLDWVLTSSKRDVAEVQTESVQLDDSARRGLPDRMDRGEYVVAYRGGTSTITMYLENANGTVVTASCTVTVTGNNDIEDVKIAKDKYALKLNTKKEATIRFNVEPYDCNFTKDDFYAVTNKSDVVDVKTVKADGEGHKGYVVVEAKKPGTAWITIKRTKDDKELDACKIIVSAVRVKTVKWKKDTVKMYWYDDGVSDFVEVKGNKVYRNKVEVKPVIDPVKAYYDIAFETSDPGVAFINPDSKVAFMNGESSTVELVAVGPGTCKITMKVDDGKKVRKASMTVEVETKRPKLKISQRTATLKLEKGKDTLQLRAYDANTDTDLEVKWTSSDTKVAKVNVDGKVRAVGAGKATITATTKNGQKQVVKCKITVKAPSTKNDAAKKITGDTKVTVKAGEKKALEIKVKPEGAKVTFTSSDSKIVKVTKDGTIKGIKAGKATITVKAAEGKAELKIKVVVK